MFIILYQILLYKYCLYLQIQKLRQLMFLQKKLDSQIKPLLCHSSEMLTKQLTELTPKVEPSSIFPFMNQVEQPEIEPVFATLTVQDILQPEYYYSYVVKKPVTQSSKVHCFKYGNLNGKKMKQINNSLETKQQQFDHENELDDVDLNECFTVMEERENLVCVVGGMYDTPWNNQLNNGNKQQHHKNTVVLKVPGKCDFKLGETLHAVCIWNPYDKYLIYIRPATKQEQKSFKLSLQSKLQSTAQKQPTNFIESRKKLLSILSSYCSPTHAMLILFSILSDKPMFVNGPNLAPILKLILPRLANIKIKAPFKQSLFPYKNQEGQLVRTPMQMGMDKTFVIIDFQQFSNEKQQKQVKIGPEEIDNLKALKMFVQQGKTIYRWEYGESLCEHCHSGLIVKASKIITPHYVLEDPCEVQKIDITEPTIELEQLQNLRVYIHEAQKFSPKLTEQARQQIQTNLKQTKNKQEISFLQQIMNLAKMQAKSQGRNQITYKDYILGKEIVLGNQKQTYDMKKNKMGKQNKQQINIMKQ